MFSGWYPRNTATVGVFLENVLSSHSHYSKYSSLIDKQVNRSAQLQTPGTHITLWARWGPPEVWQWSQEQRHRPQSWQLLLHPLNKQRKNKHWRITTCFLCFLLQACKLEIGFYQRAFMLLLNRARWRESLHSTNLCRQRGRGCQTRPQLTPISLLNHQSRPTAAVHLGHYWVVGAPECWEGTGCSSAINCLWVCCCGLYSRSWRSRVR